jgi:hypothetical protein
MKPKSDLFRIMKTWDEKRKCFLYYVQWHHWYGWSNIKDRYSVDNKDIYYRDMEDATYYIKRQLKEMAKKEKHQNHHSEPVVKSEQFIYVEA